MESSKIKYIYTHIYLFFGTIVKHQPSPHLIQNYECQ